MITLPRAKRFATATLAALALSACAGTYTGPVEVTRFISPNPDGLGIGQIALSLSNEIENEQVRNAFSAAITAELQSMGYTVVAADTAGSQTAEIGSSRNGIEGAANRRSPVSVGGGVGGGTFGGGAGLGIGINLGGGRSGPNVVTTLEVRINNPAGEALWEGRSEIATSVNSPYSDVETSARTLAAALFKDFPGGNGETVSVDVDDL